MKKSPRGAAAAAPFFASKNTAQTSRMQAGSARKGRTPAIGGDAFLPGIEEGSVLYEPPEQDIESESSLKARIRVALAAQGVLVWNNVVGRAKMPSGNWATIGLCVGSADLVGLVPPYGRFLGIETKRPKDANERESQQRWIALVRRWKGVAGFAYSVDEAEALANEARKLP